MRTTLYLSAALAAMSFSLEASAVALAPAELQQDDALAETYVNSDSNLEVEAETEKVDLPKSMNELLDMMQNGTSWAKGDQILRKTVLMTLNGTHQGNGIGPMIESQNWGAFTNKLMGHQHAKDGMEEDADFPEYKRAIRRMTHTIEDDAGWAGFKAYIKSLG